MPYEAKKDKDEVCFDKINSPISPNDFLVATELNDGTTLYFTSLEDFKSWLEKSRAENVS